MLSKKGQLEFVMQNKTEQNPLEHSLTLISDQTTPPLLLVTPTITTVSNTASLATTTTIVDVVVVEECVKLETPTHSNLVI